MFTIESKSIKELLNSIKDDIMKMPSFQRNFVWDHNQQKELIASILSGIPSGGFLAYNGEINLNVKRIGVDSRTTFSGNPNDLYLLDGQQRVTTIYSVFHDLFYKNNPMEYFKKIQNRWFIDLNYKNISHEDLFGYNLLSFDSKYLKNADPDDVINYIIFKDNLENETNNYYYNNDDDKIIA